MFPPKNYFPNRKYFIGITLPKQEDRFFADIKRRYYPPGRTYSPPHITIKSPFTYHFEQSLVDQLVKWAKQQTPFSARFRKLNTFKQKDAGSITLWPDKAEPFRKLEQSLSTNIKFLPEMNEYVPHLTLAHRIPNHQLVTVKEELTALNLDLDLEVNSISLLRRDPPEDWQVI